MDTNKSFDPSLLTSNSTNSVIPSQEEFLQFKKSIASIINLDLTNYKNAQMERRITSLMNKNKINGLEEYARVLKSSQERLDEFLNMLTINVSEFFRNKNKFDELESIYLPELLSKKNKVKIWSAGCSIGAEVYSTAMILDKMGKLGSVELVASDFDQKIIQKAKSGTYTQMEVGTVPEEYKKYFLKIGEDSYRIDPKITSRVRFTKQDLLNSKFETGFDLIMCRNVVIYFTDAAKDKLYKEFYNSLNPEGILFIGSTERINGHVEIGYKLRTSFYYQK